MGLRTQLFNMFSGSAVDERVEALVASILLKNQDRTASDALDLAREALTAAKQAHQLAKSALATAESGADGVSDVEDQLSALTHRLGVLEAPPVDKTPAPAKKPAAKKTATKKPAAKKTATKKKTAKGKPPAKG
jgi:hypothetical protein